ncbi:c-type cytochrome [Bradyrhizobium pachyrhizi]|jgi:mono/diheme cytochrome c family protein|uniref:C-type cytochrome n=1 Tax=Bradyrhizobium pachyrhizi TaxID=280333 RepID=A0A844SXA0_9BRAD|nr:MULTISPECIES: c-type cytochrome [Bradyrhizobium]MCS3450427.1 mono/diheme cytochrome c family protein [Bradyrhizobium elkanii]MCS3558428.1 mono/diheme cytochrome c family protein [Bradyrhizobium elkanii]MCW2151725.1 mono/diheme cytochrome c family protein [Bradyrhizobium elkanii]MCW2358402.1 mono/diheme cytochrome c family protein [Bradyrhizobium elkanii]MCW2375456.1 mono/diheme cytochrome c family protein [Bradyrhizobium elkanii]
MKKNWLVGAWLGCALVMGFIGTAQAQSASDPTDAGKAVFKRGNCVGCHKWHGNGGGGYGGDALSLRKTELTREQIIETVTCGRPGTGMPFFVRGSYDTTKCYEMTRQDVADRMPPEANVFLRPNEIEAVADYVLARVKGKGEPTYDECIAFFGDGSRVCNIYKEAGHAAAPSDQSEKAKP